MIDFNEGKEVGMKNLFAHLGVEVTAYAQAFFKHEDQLRLYKSQKGPVSYRRRGESTKLERR